MEDVLGFAQLEVVCIPILVQIEREPFLIGDRNTNWHADLEHGGPHP
jgi:hypothetical protein